MYIYVLGVAASHRTESNKLSVHRKYYNYICNETVMSVGGNVLYLSR